MEYLYWFLYGFVLMAIGLVVGSWRTNRQIIKLINDIQELSKEELKRKLAEIHKKNLVASDRLKRVD